MRDFYRERMGRDRKKAREKLRELYVLHEAEEKKSSPDREIITDLEHKIDRWEQELFSATISEHGALFLGGSVKSILYDDYLEVKPE